MQEAVKRGAQKAWRTYMALIKVIIPVYVGVKLLKYTGVISYLADIFSPAVSFSTQIKLKIWMELAKFKYAQHTLKNLSKFCTFLNLQPGGSGLRK